MNEQLQKSSTQIFQWANETGAHGMAKVTDLLEQGWAIVSEDSRYGSKLMRRGEVEA